MFDDYVEVRCPNDKKHGDFSKCGGFIGALPLKEGSSAVFKCGKCRGKNNIWDVTVDSDLHLNYKSVNGHINLKSLWREILSE